MISATLVRPPDAVDSPPVAVVPWDVAIVYPTSAQRIGFEGMVAARFTVSTDGLVRDITVMKSTRPEFSDAVVSSAQRLRFIPARRDGKPVPCEVVYEFSFGFIDD